MGPATVCSCEHRSTNVPVLSFHKLSRDLVQLARERSLMMGWWDGKKRSENSDVTEERLCFKCAKRDDGVGCRYFGLIHHDLKLVQRRYTCSMMFIRLQNSEFPDFTIQSIFLSTFASKSSSLIPQPPSPIQ